MTAPRRVGLRWPVLSVLLLAVVVGHAAGQPGGDALPRRPTERPLMTTSVPHMQVDVRPRVSVHDQLFRSAFSLPDVENRPAGVVGARTIWLPDTVVGARRDGNDAGRPGAVDAVGHIHADGSLHVNLPEDRMREVVNARWGARHPTIDDYAMLFTPQSMSVAGEPRFHDEQRCTYLIGKDVEEAHIYDLGPHQALAQCQDWDTMLADGSLVQIDTVLGDEIDLTLSVVYLNPKRLGRCALGDGLFDGLDSGILNAGSPAQGFWVGVSGRSADTFVPEQLWVVQGDREMGLSLKGEYDAETRLSTLGDIEAQYLVVYGAELDATQPMRVIYVSSIGPLSSEYRVDAYYR